MTDQDPSQDVTKVVPTPVEPPAPAEPVTPVAPLQPAPVQPVATSTGAPRQSRGRWAVAIGAALVVVAITAGVVFALVGRSPDATVLGYVPSGTVVYGEVRLDLPGDQRAEIGEFLSHFPGFADRTALDTKLDEVLDQVVSDATKDKATFTRDIKPWFDGELAFSVGPLPDPKSITTPANGGMSDVHGLALLSIKDAALAQTWFDAAFKEKGATTTTEAYNGATLTLFGGSDGPKAAFAIVDGKVAVAGDVASVKAAVDSKGDGGFADEADPKAALDSASGDHLGFVYVGLKPLMAWSHELQSSLKDQLGAQGGAVAGSPMSAAMLKFVPDWGAYWLRVEGDAVVMEATAPKPAAMLGPTQDRASDVAKHVPSTAIALAVSHDVGATLQQVLELYKTEPGLKEITDALDKGLGVLGGADSAVGWIGDTGIVVNRTGDTVEGGLVILPTDAKAASSFFTSVKNLAALSGVPGVTFRDEDHNGTTITTATIDASSLANGAARMFTLPVDKIEIAWAATDDVVVIGSGPAFVKHVLDTTDATSLASNDRYKGLVERAGTGTASAFVDIASVRDLVEGTMKDPDARKAYETNVKPFLAPLDALIASSSVGGDVTRSKVIITVK